MTTISPLLLLVVGFVVGSVNGQQQQYLGSPLGAFNEKAHGAKGQVFVVDESTIFIKNFEYDGEGPDAYFWAGSSPKPDSSGFIIPDEKGSTKILGKYEGKDLLLKLPEGKTIRDINYISVWCRQVEANFADVFIPAQLSIPAPVEIAPLSQLAHDVRSGPITIVDAQTFLITDFHYDGAGPAGYWWASRGSKQNAQGTHLNDENGARGALRRYSGETVVISLPEGQSIWDYDFIGVWCEEFRVDFGNTRIPHSYLVPPSPSMLGVRPEVRPIVIPVPAPRTPRPRPTPAPRLPAPLPTRSPPLSSSRRRASGITRRPRGRRPSNSGFRNRNPAPLPRTQPTQAPPPPAEPNNYSFFDFSSNTGGNRERQPSNRGFRGNNGRRRNRRPSEERPAASTTTEAPIEPSGGSRTFKFGDRLG